MNRRYAFAVLVGIALFMPTSAWAQGNENGNGGNNGNGNANGHDNDNDSNGGGNGNGNGHSNGNGSGYTVAPPPEPESSQALRLFLPRTDDFDADVRLMQTVDRVLRQSSGEDAVFIHMPNAVGTVLLKPRHKVRCDDMLLGALREVLGSESVVMER